MRHGITRCAFGVRTPHPRIHDERKRSGEKKRIQIPDDVVTLEAIRLSPENVRGECHETIKGILSLALTVASIVTLVRENRARH